MGELLVAGRHVRGLTRDRRARDRPCGFGRDQDGRRFRHRRPDAVRDQVRSGGGSGVYDVKGLEVDELMVSGGTAGKVTFKNVMSGTELAVSSKAPASDKAVATTADVSYMLANRDDESLTLKLHTRGGKKDKLSDLSQLERQASKMMLKLILDKDVEELTVHSTATVASTVAADDRPKAINYVNHLTVTEGNKIEETTCS